MNISKTQLCNYLLYRTLPSSFSSGEHRAAIVEENSSNASLHGRAKSWEFFLILFLTQILLQLLSGGGMGIKHHRRRRRRTTNNAATEEKEAGENDWDINRRPFFIPERGWSPSHNTRETIEFLSFAVQKSRFRPKKSSSTTSRG